MTRSEPTQRATAAAEPAAFYDELDASKRQAGKSCCTLWTLGLLLVAALGVGLWLIF